MVEMSKLEPSETVDARGHRAFVGGTNPETWYGIGKLQYHFLVARGLKPSHRFLDIACGSLRLGQYVIPYLGTGCYFGIDGEPKLVELGLRHEFHAGVIDIKKPSFAFNYDFDFSFVGRFDVAMAQSLFTHLTLEAIGTCFENLSSVADKTSVFYFTFNEGDPASNPSGPSHPLNVWRYSFDQIRDVVEAAGWSVSYIGDWEHPRGQRIAFAVPR